MRLTAHAKKIIKAHLGITGKMSQDEHRTYQRIVCKYLKYRAPVTNVRVAEETSLDNIDHKAKHLAKLIADTQPVRLGSSMMDYDYQ